MATTVRRTVLTLPAAATGPENPLPALRPLDEMHVIDDRDRAGLPRDMARQIGHEPLATVLPVRILDGYGRERTPTGIDAIVIENDRLRATVLPGLGGRVHSFFHKPTGRDLVYTNPDLQPLHLKDRVSSHSMKDPSQKSGIRNEVRPPGKSKESPAKRPGQRSRK